MEQRELTVIYPINCGNSPRIHFIKDLNIHMAKQQLQFFYDHITDDIHWSILGLQTLKGKGKVIKLMEGRRENIAIELNLKSIISHGTAGAVNGTVTLENHERYAYCSIYTFTSNSKKAMIKEMTTYFHKEDD